MSERSQIFGDRSDSLGIFISAIISQSFLLRCRPPILFILIYLHTVAGFFYYYTLYTYHYHHHHYNYPTHPPAPFASSFLPFSPVPGSRPGHIQSSVDCLSVITSVGTEQPGTNHTHNSKERKRRASVELAAAASRKLDFHIILRLNSKKLSIFCACEIFGFEKRAVQKERKNPVHHAGRIHTFVLKLNRQKRKI
jgi:hypothetical protein